MRDARGRFDFNLGPEELAHYNKLNLKTELERILTAPFDSGGERLKLRARLTPKTEDPTFAFFSRPTLLSHSD